MTTEYAPGQKIRAIYWIVVYKPKIGGWRSEKVFAELEVITPGRARVVSVGLESAMSNRQEFNLSYTAANEIGKVMIISNLDSVEVIE